MERPLNLFAKLVFWFVAANALAGALSLILFPARTDSLFFWPIKPPINAALFGALYLGGALVVGWTAYRGLWESARFLMPILVTAGILISAITVLHIDRFVPGFKLIYWLLVYIGAPLLMLIIYWQHERGGANLAAAEPIKKLTRTIAVVSGAALTALGLFLVVAPGAAVAQWPWATTPLIVRIFAAWFTAFGAGLLWFLKERDWRLVRNIATLMIFASVLDLAMIIVHRADIQSTGLSLWVYCFHLALLGVLGLAMHLIQGMASPKTA